MIFFRLRKDGGGFFSQGDDSLHEANIGFINGLSESLALRFRVRLYECVHFLSRRRSLCGVTGEGLYVEPQEDGIVGDSGSEIGGGQIVVV